MRIAQIAPPIESVPPAYYGGTERVVSYLTEELVRQGHQVTLFASGDSLTSAELVPSHAARFDSRRQCNDPIPYYLLMLDQVRSGPTNSTFCISTSTSSIFRSFDRSLIAPLTTLHGRQHLTDLNLYRGFTEMPLSRSPTRSGAGAIAEYVATVYHGIPTDLHGRILVRAGVTWRSLGAFARRRRRSRYCDRPRQRYFR